MKTGILNVQWISNYGGVLLGYAMQKQLDRMGIDSEIIDFRPQEPDQYGEIKSAHPEEKLSSPEKTASFFRFRKSFIRRSDPVTDISKAGELRYDAYIVGSDTVWTPLKVYDVEAEMFYLNFAKEQHVPKISWAASVGTDDKAELERMRPILTERLRNFDHISVRERETAEYIQSLTEKEVVHAIDPVLMLDKEDYNEILPGTTDPGRKYVYAFLFNDPPCAVSTINELSERTGLPVVANVKSAERIRDLLQNSENDGPSEFVERIYNAEYVITDSYHGAIFAILAKKPFVCYTRIGSGVRARNLLEDLGLADRFLTETENGVDRLLSPIDYDAVFARIAPWRKRSEEYLKKALR